MQLTPGSKKATALSGLLSNHERQSVTTAERYQLGFETRISCLQDRRFDQLSHGAPWCGTCAWCAILSNAAEGWVFSKALAPQVPLRKEHKRTPFQKPLLRKCRCARTHKRTPKHCWDSNPDLLFTRQAL